MCNVVAWASNHTGYFPYFINPPFAICGAMVEEMDTYLIRPLKRKSTPEDDKDNNDNPKKNKIHTNELDTCTKITETKVTNGPIPEDEKLKVKVEIEKEDLQWKEIRAENLNLDYCLLYSRQVGDDVLRECEETLTYNQGMLAKVKIFGKWHDIPRQQVAHGDSGLTYSFSNNTVPARPWMPMLQRIRDRITCVTGYNFNFVLINKYRDGNDHMGEHRDDEKDLVQGYPIASLSLGQARDFVFKHADSRGKNAKRKIEPLKVELQHGSLLLMKHPTNIFWYHSLPSRKRLPNVRINMTFRKMVVK